MSRVCVGNCIGNSEFVVFVSVTQWWSTIIKNLRFVWDFIYLFYSPVLDLQLCVDISGVSPTQYYIQYSNVIVVVFSCNYPNLQNMYHTYIHTMNIPFPLLNIENMVINIITLGMSNITFKTWKGFFVFCHVFV